MHWFALKFKINGDGEEPASKNVSRLNLPFFEGNCGAGFEVLWEYNTNREKKYTRKGNITQHKP